MVADLLIRDALIISPSGRAVGSVAILDGKIVHVGSPEGIAAQVQFDARNLALLPGVIDTQVHFREPGLEHKEDIESGTRAAICGGVTTIFEMPNTSPPTVDEASLNDKLKRADGRAWCDYAFFVGATAENAHELGWLELLPGTPGIKIFMGSSTGSLLVPDDENLRKVLTHARHRCPIHAEDHQRLEDRKKLFSASPSVIEHPFLRDAECARLATERILRLSQETGCPVHILHVSTSDELPLLAAAKAQRHPITCEATPQHLWFAAPDCYLEHGTFTQMNPPIRSAEHREALRQAVKAGLFDVFGSDHAPHTKEEKAKPYPQSPSGIPGVQTMLPILLTLCKRDGMISLEKLVEMTSEAPAKLYGIKNKGKIEVGYDADLVFVDLNRREIITEKWLQSKCGWSPFTGETIHGWITDVFLRGQHVVEDGQLKGKPQGYAVAFDR